MELWIPITIVAAFMQNVRTALQKHLTDRTSVLGVTFARFAFGLPFALLIGGIVLLQPNAPAAFPQTNLSFFAYAATGGIAQIFATLFLVGGFQLRNFAVATTLSKTETVQTALVGIILLGETLTLGAAAAILVSLVGVLMMSAAKAEGHVSGIMKSLMEKPALIGLASGGLFGVSAVCYRGASLSLASGTFLERTVVTLMIVVAIQTFVMTIYLILREREQLRRVIEEWRSMILIGLTGTAGSVCWFAAMTLQNAAYVRAVGQLELVFTFIASFYFFREKIDRLEVFGVLLVIGGVVFLVLQ